ncbi:hypothetical protein, conserved [Babesia ovata]|uniref:C3H1-type domain-containing protein n=1 Tax=Babesia ovata TaxID=189622 RepID=A0A2H6KAK8_9APIC|nr:uncharacterized protein BOVATA_014820 [Babesia ovata]GBE59989.1 hypothetical protein, conserved [Babesia ovata]
MAFLHGVLSNIKPKLGLHSHHINEAIRLLNAHKHRGKEGFNAAIDKVVQGVRQYNEGVKASNKKVSEPMKNLQREMETLKIQVSKITDFHSASGTMTRLTLEELKAGEAAEAQKIKEAETAVSSINELLKQCESNANKFNSDLDISKRDVENRVNDLSSNLSLRVKHVIGSVKHETERLDKLSKEEQSQLNETKEKIKATLDELGRRINMQISEQVKEVTKKWKASVQNFLVELNEIYLKLGEYVKELASWIEEAKKVIEFAEQNLKQISCEVTVNEDGTKPKRWNEIDQVTTTIGSKAEELHGKFNEMKDKYVNACDIIHGDGSENVNTGGVVGKLRNLHSNITEKVPNDVKTLTHHHGKWKLSTQMWRFKTEIQQNVENYLQSLKQALDQGIAERENHGTVTANNAPALEALSKNEELKKKLGKLGGLFETAKEDIVQGGLGYNIESIINCLKEAKKDWGSSSTRLLIDALKEAISEKAIAVNDKFGELLQKAIQQGVSELQLEMDGLVGQFDDITKNVITSLETLAQAARGAVEQNAGMVVGKLYDLCETIKSQGRYTKERLEELKRLMFTDYITINRKDQMGLNEIKNKLNNLHKTLLEGPIKKAETLLSQESQQFERDCISYLADHVHKQLKQATDELTTHARRQYVNSLKTLLTEFAAKCLSDLNGLPNEVTKDSDRGVKGFMNKFEEKFLKDEKAIEGIKKIKTAPSADKSPLSQAAGKLNHAVKRFFLYYHKHVDFVSDFRKIEASKDALQKMLAELITSQHFSHEFSNNLQSLTNQLGELHPSEFGASSTPMLQSLKEGIIALVGELGRAYVSRYSQRTIEWDKIGQAEKEKYAKIALTLTPVVYHELTALKEGLENGWESYKIYDSSNSNHSLHKLFFAYNGYDVGRPAESPYGELNHKKDFNGSNILAHLNNERHKLYSKITTPITVMSDSQIQSDEPPLTIEEENGVVRQLFDHLNKYFGVCHLNYIDKPRSPCSIYDMSLWLSGLPHNPVYEKLKQQIKTMFEVPSETDPSQKIVAPVKAYPQQFTNEHIHDALDKVTSHAYMLLTGVVGHGDAATFYACDFPTNSISLYYPASGAECLDMLLDILRRMFPVLTFLHTQCSLRDKHGGWRDCYYGKDIKSTKLACNEHVTDKARCQPNCQASTKANCQPTSPLMSYLNDSLHGHLPHDVTSIGCKSSCNTCANSPPGMPCLPPLGFRAFSNSTHTGRDLCELLAELVGKRGVVTKLYAPLACLLNRAPKTFPDLFAFYYRLVRTWTQASEYRKISQSIQNDIRNVIVQTVSCKDEDAGRFMDACLNFNECSSHFMHDKNTGMDISYLVGCGQSDCGYIMRPLNASAYNVFAPKFASSYLSWLLYACSNIYNFLDQLKNSFCDISCYDHQCGPCLNSAGCAKDKHGTKPCGCSSIVQCRGVSSVFYRYGLAYADAAGRSQIKCQDFCAALDKILQSQTLKNFLSAIDEFMFTVRKNFIWTLLGLWAFSFLYLLHILVVRLDVLRIRSHLRSPSSHRIAAQSLLAAARVRALANVKYFSP